MPTKSSGFTIAVPSYWQMSPGYQAISWDFYQFCSMGRGDLCGTGRQSRPSVQAIQINGAAAEPSRLTSADPQSPCLQSGSG